ncbi:c-type cytochrome [Bacillus sp. JJ1764]|uniref:c-type cytochrome n=1 Tax=Bacillus sp. JJ1764 TaxID=3122964 RepID=UPI002FFFF729
MKKLWTAFLFTALITSGCSSDAVKEDDKNKVVSAGEKPYNRSCAGCHGADLTGGAGPDISKVGGKSNEKEILKIIKDGKGMMPGDLLSDKDSNAVAKWLADKK